MPGNNKEQKRKRHKYSPSGKEEPKQKLLPPSSKSSSKKRDASSQRQDLESLISNLAKQVADPTAKSQSSPTSSTKAQRIQRRVAKQQRRKERQQQKQQQQTVSSSSSSKTASAAAQGNASKKRAAPHHHQDDTTQDRPHVSWRTTQQTRKRLKHMTGLVKEIIQKQQVGDEDPEKKDGSSINIKKRGPPPKPFEGFVELKKSKKTKKWDQDNVQPRSKDYGGLGLALPSLFLSLEDPSFIRRLEDEFQEHIDGFFGKQRTKAMKKQLDGDMLWRKMSNMRKSDKQQQPQQQKVNGRKLSDMTPDQRVEAMLKAGFL